MESAQEANAPAKRTFLKRGEGVARFGVNGKPPPPRPKKTRASKAGSKSARTVQSSHAPERTTTAGSKDEGRKVGSGALRRTAVSNASKKQEENKKGRVRPTQKSQHFATDDSS